MNRIQNCQKPSQSAFQPVSLERCQTRRQLVEIRRHPVYGNQLIIDRDLQISESDAAYNTAMIAPLLKLADCRQVAILGGGDGGVLHEFIDGLRSHGQTG